MITASFVSLLVIVLDFFTKYIVKMHMSVGESFSIIPGLFNITYVLNKGAAWGILSDKRWIFLSFSLVALALVGIFIYRFRNENKALTVSLALIFGGGFGNMIDRIFNGEVLFDGAVVDFIETAFMDFPVFNVADCAVVIGACLLLVYIIFIDGKNNNKCTSGCCNSTEKKAVDSDFEDSRQ